MNRNIKFVWENFSGASGKREPFCPQVRAGHDVACCDKFFCVASTLMASERVGLGLGHLHCIPDGEESGRLSRVIWRVSRCNAWEVSILKKLLKSADYREQIMKTVFFPIRPSGFRSVPHVIRIRRPEVKRALEKER